MTKKRTFKQEMLDAIEQRFDRSTLPRLPRSLLNDLSTANLVAFLDWITPLASEKPKPSSTKLLGPGTKKTRG